MKKIHIFSLILSIVILTSCAGEKSSLDSSRLLEYPTEIRVSDPITIRICDSLSFVGLQEKIEKAVSISPRIDSKVEILNSRTIAIRPSEKLNFNAIYKVSVDMGKLFSKEGVKGVKSFEVKTLAPIFKYSDEGLSVYSDREGVYYLKGLIESSEIVDSKSIEQSLKVSGSSIKPVWSHNENGIQHTFTLENIEAEEGSYTLAITRDFSNFNDREPQTISYLIPAKGKFMVMSGEVYADPYRFDLFFSSALDRKQPFKELVTVPGGGDVKFIIDKNRLSIYPTVKREKRQEVIVSKLIKSLKGETLENDWERKFDVPSNKPYVRFISSGSVLPSTEGMKIHFQALNFGKVRVRVNRIFENNILQFFQESYYDSKYAYYIHNVASIVADTTFALSSPNGENGVVNYGIDLSHLVKPQKGAIYKVEIRGYDRLVSSDEQEWESDYYFGSYEDYEMRTLNILSSDLGVIAKGSEAGEYTFFVHNLLTAKPVSGAKISVYNRVNQLIGESSTSGNGTASILLNDKPQTAIVTYGDDKSYIKLENAVSLSLSNFDVQGAAVKRGQKGFIFGERGVWRPGDDIHITFISTSAEGALPANHPVTAVLTNPHSQVVQTITNTKGSNGLYSFKFKTDDSAPTGNWGVEIKAGGVSYSKILKIESVKPNKLLIDLKLNGNACSDKPVPASAINGSMGVKWLAGNPGVNLKTKVEVDLLQGKTEFSNYKGYIFEDDSRAFYAQTKEIASGKTDDAGIYNFSSSLEKSGAVSGFMKGVFTTRVFEPSGDFSIDNFTATISPYDRYVGIKVPESENDWGSSYLDIKNVHKVDVVAVDMNGVTVPLPKVDVELYKMGWNWWWGSSSSDYLASYSRDSYNKPYKFFSCSLKDGRGAFELDLTSQESGYYFIRVVDPKGGHAASKVVMVCEQYSNEARGGVDGATRLMVSTDKAKYNVGESANLSFPAASGARAIITLEKGEKIIKSFSVECTGTAMVVPIAIEEGMAPNIYASVTLIQPYNTTLNDAPIRMFGVIRVDVEDPSTHLYPVITVKDEVRPESEVSISVKERDGKRMSYVIAIVDEGLLSLTRFKTPDPWSSFFATEALGVRTWDIYDMVIGAYGARMEKLFAIGGDGEGATIPSRSKAERFKPVSLFLGPYTTSGRSETHKVVLPQYIGNLRVMVIATNGESFGSTQKSLLVRKPLMVQTTLPRVVSVNEEIEVPVTLFAVKGALGKVDVKIKPNGSFSVVGTDSKSVEINGEGEETISFRLKAGAEEGIGKISVAASCSSDEASEMLEIDIREPNPVMRVSETLLLGAGEERELDFSLAGKAGSNIANIELSNLPPINLDYRLSYVTDYPHGCIEQSVSSVFPLLYVSALTSLSQESSIEYEERIKRVIDKLQLFLHPSGGMTYWPSSVGYGNGDGVSLWGTIYAAHFMVEASAKGYAVPASLLKRVLSYIKSRASRNDDSLQERAYACYVLSLSGDAPRGVMNRLRSEASLGNSDKWFLAAAYAADNKFDIAREIVGSMSSEQGRDWDVRRFSNSFDSRERELATAVMVYTSLGDFQSAFNVVKTLSMFLNERDYWMSTQSTSWALNAVAAYAKSQGDSGSAIDLKIVTPFDRIDHLKGENGTIVSKELLSKERSKQAEVASGKLPVYLKNNSSSQTYITVSSQGVPAQGSESRASSGLSIRMTYTSTDGTRIDPSDLVQGTDFIIYVTVTNTNPITDYTNLVLSHIFPSGWEFKRDRSDYFYQDLRDDRIYSYFDLAHGKEIAFSVRATATYNGRFYIPATTCEAMYDHSVYAATAGGWCTVR